MTEVRNEAFGNLIASARMRLGLSQREVAKRIGLRREHMTQWENGQLFYTPRPEHLNPLCAYLGIPVAELLTALGYDLVLSPEELRELSRLHLTEDEEHLLRTYRSVPAALRPLVLHLALAAAEQQLETYHAKP